MDRHPIGRMEEMSMIIEPISPVQSEAKPISSLRSRVIHGDCITMMRTMGSKSVDLVLTEPPYLSTLFGQILTFVPLLI
jgi:predicted methyltransferase